MISYEKLFKMLKAREISTYVLRYEWGIASETVQRLKKNEPVSITTFDKLCHHLNCRIEDIMEYVPDREV